MTLPHRADDPYDWPALLALITRAFAGMEGRINPPSSARHLTAKDLAATSQASEIWVLGSPPQACMIFSPKPDRLYLGKLAVNPAHQGKGLARTLVAHAEIRTRALGFARLDLQTRVELTENHEVFQRLGFHETARTSDAGFSHPTTITLSKFIQV